MIKNKNNLRLFLIPELPGGHFDSNCRLLKLNTFLISKIMKRYFYFLNFYFYNEKKTRNISIRLILKTWKIKILNGVEMTS